MKCGQENKILHIRLDYFPCPQNKLIKNTRAMTPVDALFLSEELESAPVQFDTYCGMDIVVGQP